MVDVLRRCSDAYSRARITITDGTLEVSTSDYVDYSYPIHLYFGPLGMSLGEDETLEYADALIRAVHHRRAAIAAMMVSETGDST